MSPDLPPVDPSVTAELVAALSPRLRKRLDAGIAKLADRPAVRDGDTVRVAVDDTTHVELHAPGGAVTGAAAVRCGCLLAPDCLHRAAAASLAPVHEPAPEAAGEAEAAAVAETTAAEAPAGEEATAAGEAPSPPPHPEPEPGLGPDPGPGPEAPTPDQCAAARAVRDAVVAVLEAGVDGAGGVVQAELLRAAHAARIAGLPRLATAAVAVVTGVRAARSADPAYRLADLGAALRETLLTAHLLPRATGAEFAALRGTARRPYTPDGSLRLYGLFTEPVLTTTGYAGAVTWTADAEGRLLTVSDVAPGGAGRAVGAAGRAVRIGDTALTHRELSRAGLAVSGATVSPTGRLGAGAGVRAVRAAGAAWTAEPLDRLWAEPVAEQVGRALAGERDLLFLDLTLTGTVREAAGDCLVAECGGRTVRLAVAHDDPALPYRDNLRLLAAAPGTRLRVVGRLALAPHPRVLLLASSLPGAAEGHVDLGTDRLQRADLAVAAASPAPAMGLPEADEAPVHVLSRRVLQGVAGGRPVLAAPGEGGRAGERNDSDGRRLRRAGLTTAAELLRELVAAAADRSRDAFGRLLPADADRFGRAWLAAACYTAEVERALCAAAWGADIRDADARHGDTPDADVRGADVRDADVPDGTPVVR
ncbi:hypothetical protein [Streptomyces mangrovisoli]|uniref:hypothetical protein n=1 Tax=Streptomyces mangrovisoli TaxID=1428628 RepID=UPI000A561AAF|nr:hypothetical protein [Streptomyces mangrovisoli]